MANDLTVPSDFANPQMALLFAALQDGTREWRDELSLDGEPEPDELQQPLFPGGHSMGAVLLHIADVEVRWIETRLMGLPRDFIEEKFMNGPAIDMDKSIWPEPPLLTLAEHFRILDEVRARTRRHLKEIDAERTFEHRKETFTARWTVNHLIGHEAYHAGQILLIRQALIKGV